jgi:hypothetical protein
MIEEQSKCLQFPLEVLSHFQPYDHGPASPNLPALLQAVPRLVFEVMKSCCLHHLEFISYFVLVLRALSALTVEQAFCGLLPELALFLLALTR